MSKLFGKKIITGLYYNTLPTSTNITGRKYIPKDVDMMPEDEFWDIIENHRVDLMTLANIPFRHRFSFIYRMLAELLDDENIILFIIKSGKEIFYTTYADPSIVMSLPHDMPLDDDANIKELLI